MRRSKAASCPEVTTISLHKRHATVVPLFASDTAGDSDLVIRAEPYYTAAGASLHLCCTPHGPDTATFEAAVGSGAADQPPVRASCCCIFIL